MTHNIAVIGGDGIGPEVTAEAVKVIRAAGVDIATTDFDLGGQRYLRDGEILVLGPEPVVGRPGELWHAHGDRRLSGCPAGALGSLAAL